MGLDIYLYTREQHEQNEASEKASEARWARLEAGEITDEENERLREEEPQYVHYTDVPSREYPEGTLNNRRYLRSSYNSGGFNSAVSQMLGDEAATYYGIFAPVIGDNPEPYETVLTSEHVESLRVVAANARDVASRIRTADGYRVTTIESIPVIGPQDHLWHSAPTDDEALAWFREEDSKPKTGFLADSGYSSAKGTYLGEKNALQVVGWVEGERWGSPAVHLIYKSEGDTEHYAVSASIAAEFAEEAIELIEKDGSCVMCWSG